MINKTFFFFLVLLFLLIRFAATNWRGVTYFLFFFVFFFVFAQGRSLEYGFGAKSGQILLNRVRSRAFPPSAEKLL